MHEYVRGKRFRRAARGGALAAAALAVAIAATARADPKPNPKPATDSCVRCHANPDFLVTNRKLYDYFQDWQYSIHKQEGVTCSDCHGGDPDASDKARAHNGGVGEATATSAVNFKNIPETCGQCHDEIRDSYRKSHHAKHLLKRKDEAQGPNCVTCHGAMNVSVLNVTNVEAACARCHNPKTKNHPKIPARATQVLNRFLSIQRFYRYVNIRMQPEEARQFLQELDPRLRELSVTWHTFDLDRIDEKTHEVLELLRQKRDELRRRQAAAQVR